MFVHIITDTPGKLSDLCSMLGPQHRVSHATLKAINSGRSSWNTSNVACDVVIIAADLRIVESISAIKQMAPRLGSAQKRIFIIDQKGRLFGAQAYALGATHVWSTRFPNGRCWPPVRILTSQELPATTGPALGMLHQTAKLRSPQCSPQR